MWRGELQDLPCDHRLAKPLMSIMAPVVGDLREREREERERERAREREIERERASGT